jgi:hypothetical protein
MSGERGLSIPATKFLFAATAIGFSSQCEVNTPQKLGLPCRTTADRTCTSLFRACSFDMERDDAGVHDKIRKAVSERLPVESTATAEHCCQLVLVVNWRFRRGYSSPACTLFFLDPRPRHLVGCRFYSLQMLPSFARIWQRAARDADVMCHFTQDPVNR